MSVALVGRADQLSWVAEQLTAGSSVVLSGNAGIGKTRLASAALQAVAASGTPVARIVGTPAASRIPLAAFAGLLADQPGDDVVARVAASLSIGENPVLHVDDLHDLDERSVGLVHQMVASGSLRIIATIRTSEELSSPTCALLADPTVQRNELRSLGQDDIRDLLAGTLGGPVDDVTARTFASISDGNLLFLNELVRGTRDSNRLTLMAGMWRLTGDLDTTPLLDELVAARRSALSSVAQEGFDLLAVGEEIPFDLLLKIVPAEAIEELERADLATARRVGHRLVVSSPHPLYREVGRREMPAIARFRHSRQLGEAAAALSMTEPADRLRGVLWRLDGGIPDAPEVLYDAAQLSFKAGDLGLSARLALASFEANKGTSAALLASWCLEEQGDLERSRDVLHRAIAAPELDPVLAPLLRVRLAEQLWWRDRNLDAAYEALDKIELDEPHGAAFADAQRAVFAVMEAEPNVALEYAARITGTTETVNVPWVSATAAMATSLAHLISGRPVTAAELAAAAFEQVISAPSGDLSGDPGVHVVTRGYSLVHAGEFEEMRGLADLAHSVVVDGNSDQAKAWVAMMRGELALVVGNPVEAERWYVQAEVGWLSAGLTGPARWGASGAALALALMRDTAKLDATVERASSYDLRGFQLFESRFIRARLWLAFLAGRTGVVDDLLAAAKDEVAAGCGQMALECAIDLLRWDAPFEAAEVLAAHCAGQAALEGPVAALRIETISASCERDGPRLDEVSVQLEELGLRLEAAEASAYAARSHRRGGAEAAAERSAGRSGKLAAACPGAATPPLGDRRSSSSCSARELQIAGLAANGLSTPEIADKLFVSKRTVENHLYRAFTKLGVTSRSELAAALEDP